LGVGGARGALQVMRAACCQLAAGTGAGGHPGVTSSSSEPSSHQSSAISSQLSALSSPKWHSQLSALSPERRAQSPKSPEPSGQWHTLCLCPCVSGPGPVPVPSFHHLVPDLVPGAWSLYAHFRTSHSRRRTSHIAHPISPPRLPAAKLAEVLASAPKKACVCVSADTDSPPGWPPQLRFPPQPQPLVGIIDPPAAHIDTSPLPSPCSPNAPHAALARPGLRAKHYSAYS
jgi:hypothetical protein